MKGRSLYRQKNVRTCNINWHDKGGKVLKLFCSGTEIKTMPTRWPKLEENVYKLIILSLALVELIF